MNKDCEKIIISKEEITSKVKELGEEITRDYEGKDIVFIPILTGGFLFASDVIREVDLPCTIDFMQVSTYGDGVSSSGNLNIKKDISNDICGKDVIILEDILDTGFTLSCLKKYLEEKKPNSIKICTFIDKPARRKENIVADYYGYRFEEDLFLVGYGLDYAQKYRNLPYVAILKKEIYS